MELVKNAVDDMIEGVTENEFGLNWTKPTANYSGEKFYEWWLTESVVELDEDKAIADKINELIYTDLIEFVNSEAEKINAEVLPDLKWFTIPSALLNKSLLNEKTLRYTYELRLSYYLAF